MSESLSVSFALAYHMHQSERFPKMNSSAMVRQPDEKHRARAYQRPAQAHTTVTTLNDGGVGDVQSPLDDTRAGSEETAGFVERGN
jgi:hypothetical protein